MSPHLSAVHDHELVDGPDIDGRELEVDHELVGRLRVEVVEALRLQRRQRETAGLGRLSDADARQLGWSLIGRVLAEHRADQVQQGIVLPPEAVDTAVGEAVHNAVFGLGRMTPLLADPTLSEINIKGCDQVWLVKDDGTKLRGAPVAASDEELIGWVRTMATYTQLNSRAWDPTTPRLRCRLPDGSRLTAVMGASARPVLSIRMLRRPRVSLDDLRALGTFDEQVQAFLTAAVRARQNMLLSGATHSGKTTLLRALTQAIPADERLVTVERFRELGLEDHGDLHPDVVELEEQPANGDGEGGQSMAELVEVSRSLDADRLIVGECLGDEIVALLEGMTQGDDGGLTTIHSRTAREVPQRVATYTAKAGMSLEQTLLTVGNAVDFVVHMGADRLDDGRLRRQISSIVEIGEYDGSLLHTSEVYGVAPGEAEPRWLVPLTDRRGGLLVRHGFDWSRAAGLR